MNIYKNVSPGPREGTVRSEDGEVLTPPPEWSFLAAGDGPLTRRVKERGPCWQVRVKKGRRLISKGIWADTEDIRTCREELEKKRATPEHARRQQAERLRRERKQNVYVEQFYRETIKYLDFHPENREIAVRLAHAVTAHATPVGSGTVARTERIELGDRVEAAVLAWMRHHTTGYDRMRIERVRGRRRQVRRELAGQSLGLLGEYRTGKVENANCRLLLALDRIELGGE